MASADSRRSTRGEISEIDNANSSGGDPMLKPFLETKRKVQWDNVVISLKDFLVGKPLGLIESAERDRPNVQSEIDSQSQQTLGPISGERFVGLKGKRDRLGRRRQPPDVAGIMRPRVRVCVSADVLSESAYSPAAVDTSYSLSVRVTQTHLWRADRRPHAE